MGRSVDGGVYFRERMAILPHQERPPSGTEKRFPGMHAGAAQAGCEGRRYFRHRHHDDCGSHSRGEKPVRKIRVLEKEISLYTIKEEDYICITDIARYKNPDRTDDLIRNWLRNRNTIEFLGIWEQLNNPDFKPVEFDGFKKQAGLNSFTLTPKQWIETTNAIGLISRAGSNGATYGHKDIAFEFASWISVEFKLCVIKECQRLKDKATPHAA